MINQYFNHVANTPETDLYHDLATEFVQLSGIDVIYIKSNALDTSYDQLFGENRFDSFTQGNTQVIEMYINDPQLPYGGGGDLFSKFGLTQNQNITFMAALRRFDDVFGGRPKEGDYIYIPKMQDRAGTEMYRITYVSVSDNQFDALGSTFFYTINTEKAVFSHETFSTGNAEIDTETTELATVDKNNDTTVIETLADTFINFTEDNPFGTP